MTLNEYVNNLVSYLADHPEYRELPVVASSDDEGNSYNLVYYTPSHDTYEMRGGEDVESICIN